MTQNKCERIRRAPSFRDQEIYARVQTQNRTQRQAAEEFGISQGRVCQVIKRVTAWIAETGGAAAAKFTPQEKLNELKAFGMPLPADLVEFERDLDVLLFDQPRPFGDVGGKFLAQFVG